MAVRSNTVRRRRIRLGIVAALTAVLLAPATASGAAWAQGSASAGLAADPDALLASGRIDVVTQVLEAEDPDAAYAELSAAEQAEFDYWMKPVEVVQVSPPVLAPAPTSDSGINACWNGFSGVWIWKSLAGVHLYEMWMNGSWCTNDVTGSATSASYTNSGGSGLAPGWRHDGRRGFASGVSGGQAKIWSQHRFVLGAGGWDVQTIDQCMRIIGAPFNAIDVDFVCTTV